MQDLILVTIPEILPVIISQVLIMQDLIQVTTLETSLVTIFLLFSMSAITKKNILATSQVIMLQPLIQQEIVLLLIPATICQTSLVIIFHLLPIPEGMSEGMLEGYVDRDINE